LIAFAGALAYLNYQQRQQLADIEGLVAKYGAIDSGRTSRPETGPSVTDAISSIAQGVALEPRYATALELLQAGKYQEAEPLLEAVAQDEKAAARDNKQTAEAIRNLASIAAISDHGKARGYYAEAAALDADHIEGMFWNGWFQAEVGS